MEEGTEGLIATGSGVLDCEFMERHLMEYAIGWNSKPGQLKTLSIFRRTVSIGSGIDHLMCDSGLS